MTKISPLPDADALAAQLDAELRALPVRNTPNARAVRRRYSRALRQAEPACVLAVADALLDTHRQRWIAYELVADHKGAFSRMDDQAVEALGRGMASWSQVDSFGRTLSGPAWLRSQLADETITRWAHSLDRWWRRAALVSTVALNSRSQGGRGDTPRTLAICRLLADDPDDMVVKALSWALRELVPWDPKGVRVFLGAHEAVLAARVKREVRNKLETGLKNPRR